MKRIGFRRPGQSRRISASAVGDGASRESRRAASAVLSACASQLLNYRNGHQTANTDTEGSPAAVRTYQCVRVFSPVLSRGARDARPEHTARRRARANGCRVGLAQ